MKLSVFYAIGLIYSLTCLGGCTLSSHDEEIEVSTHVEPITTEWHGNYNYAENHYIEIKSLSDQPVALKKVLINRGNCRGDLYYSSSWTISGYGKSSKISLLGCQIDDVREIQVDTAKNSYTFNF